MRIQKVVVLGAGAMGGLYADHFVRGGFDVAFVARGERAERLRRGVRVNGRPLGARVLDADAPGAEPPADLAVLAVKAGALADALEAAAPFVGPETIWLSVMNGLDSEEAIAERYGAAHLLHCVGFGMSAASEGAELTYTKPGTLAFAKPGAPEDPDVAAVAQACERAGLAYEIPADIRHRMWWKFLVNVAGNQASGMLRATYAQLQIDGDARDLMWALADEVVAVAGAEGVPLGEADKQQWADVLAQQTPDGRTSLLQDVEAGRPTEVEMFAGRVVALGEKHGIPTPYNRTALWVLRAGR